MHNNIINAQLQVVPVTTAVHPYEYVNKAIEEIQNSNVKHTVGAFGTVLEGHYNDVMALIAQVNERMYELNCDEWLLNIQLHIRSHRPVTATEKTERFEK